MFHEDWTINVTVKRFHEDQTINPYKEKCTSISQPPGSYDFQATRTIFALVQNIIGTNILTKFHDDLTLNVESGGKIPRLLGGHVFLTNRNHFRTHLRYFHEDRTINVASRYIIGMNYLIKFHEDRTKNVASRLLTRKNAPPLGTHVFQPNVTIFERIHYIIETNLLTTFHEHWTNNAAHTVNNSQPPGGYDFQATGTIFALVQDIIRTNLLTKFHDDLTLDVASRGNIPRPIDGHTNLLTKFHEDRTINVVSRVLSRKNAPPPGGHLSHKNVASRLLTRLNYSHILPYKENAPHLGSHVFQPNVTIFELIHYIIETNLLTTFHEHWTINVASRVLTRQMLTPHDAQRTTDDGQKAITKAQ
ncbi:hypothetical protein DPMN_143220 [Dreissena polymorpha]|uniref:Uncharacterized protein n=1 Tax=Dreissena polymorpha TaxID=45954 RepID=A0A9D4GCJ3_DREPO|nr:hypothetical protein DPMN_143220 [Dreissena polymorpha]